MFSLGLDAWLAELGLCSKLSEGGVSAWSRGGVQGGGAAGFWEEFLLFNSAVTLEAARRDASVALLVFALPACTTGTTSSMRMRLGMTGDLARKTLSGVGDADVEEEPRVLDLYLDLDLDGDLEPDLDLDLDLDL